MELLDKNNKHLLINIHIKIIINVRNWVTYVSNAPFLTEFNSIKRRWRKNNNIEQNLEWRKSAFFYVGWE